MKSRSLKSSGEVFKESNIFSDKASLVLYWLLVEGTKRNSFTLRGVAAEVGVSLGLIHKVFQHLVFYGLMNVIGVRTGKTFSFQKPKGLLEKWVEHYDITKKCRMRTYATAFETREELLQALRNSAVNDEVAFALHSAAELHGCKNTNLETVELYLLNPEVRQKVEAALELEPKERGYEVLLIDPYYRSILALGGNLAPPLLTFLDLYRFPLRGREQAELLAEKQNFYGKGM